MIAKKMNNDEIIRKVVDYTDFETQKRVLLEYMQVMMALRD